MLVTRRMGLVSLLAVGCFTEGDAGESDGGDAPTSSATETSTTNDGTQGSVSSPTATAATNAMTTGPDPDSTGAGATEGGSESTGGFVRFCEGHDLPPDACMDFDGPGLEFDLVPNVTEVMLTEDEDVYATGIRSIRVDFDKPNETAEAADGRYRYYPDQDVETGSNLQIQLSVRMDDMQTWTDPDVVRTLEFTAESGGTTLGHRFRFGPSRAEVWRDLSTGGTVKIFDEPVSIGAAWTEIRLDADMQTGSGIMTIGGTEYPLDFMWPIPMASMPLVAAVDFGPWFHQSVTTAGLHTWWIDDVAVWID